MVAAALISRLGQKGAIALPYGAPEIESGCTPKIVVHSGGVRRKERLFLSQPGAMGHRDLYLAETLYGSSRLSDALSVRAGPVSRFNARPHHRRCQRCLSPRHDDSARGNHGPWNLRSLSG